MDRAGPALQIIFNFVNDNEYRTPTGLDVTPKPYCEW